jgi:glycosyltransferase involved in cell wall biosynthesis
MTEFPRIIIFGQPFNNFSGGGITLTNLFKGWPKEKIAATYMGHGLINITTDVCDKYYQLGNEEHKWKFPLNLIQRKFHSGIKTVELNKEVQINSFQKGLRYKLVNKYFYPFLRWTGIFYFSKTISISERFAEWLSEFRPEILYLQVAAHEEVVFTNELINHLKIPVVIHMMDDWPTAISEKGLFKKYWSKKINKEFRSLLDNIDLYFSISDAMTNEYTKRYNKYFIPFHNPIDIDLWSPYAKKDHTINNNHIEILYSGRIGDNGVVESIMEVAAAIDYMNDKGNKIKLHIQTPTQREDILGRLRKYKCIVFNPFVGYNQIPVIFSRADILLLANDFSMHGVKYLKYSMPTKASEYMISGTPVLVYSSGLTAISKFFSDNECGCCITIQNREEIIKAINYLVDNEDYRKKISLNAVSLAKERFEANKVRNEFQSLIINLAKKKKNVH